MRSGALPPTEHKRSHVRAMFDRIAPRYDRVNRVMSVGLDQRWRRAALDAVRVAPGDRVLDLACGTGDLAQLARERGARVVGLDFSREMLRAARARGLRTPLVQGDACSLPFASGSVSCVTCGFALRNFVSLPEVFREISRVLEPDGRAALVEVDRPRSALLRAGHELYFDHVVPQLGALLSDRAAYRYLPESTVYLPPESELRALLETAGLQGFERRPRMLGAVQIVTARRSRTPGRVA